MIDYEKKYKEALELARDYYKANLKLNNADENLLLEDIFPELKESEDEKIRKEIIDYFISDDKYSVIKSPKYKELVALFEKQKDINSKEYVFRPLAGCDIESAAIQAVEQQKLGKKIVLAFNGAYIPVEEKTADNIVNEYYSWLEKQGKSSDQIHYWTEEEIEPIISDYLRGVEHYGGMIGRLRCLKPKSLEKQNDCSVKWQKNTPNYKPAINHSVLMKTTQGIAEGEWQGEDWFQYRWSWTLKDSDVLAWMELSNLDKQGEQKPAVVDFNAKDWYVSKVDGKIHDMTYNPTDKVEPKFNIGDVLCDKSCTTLDKNSQPNIEILDIRAGMYICNNCSFPISQQDEYELVAKRVEPQSAWSEEDDYNLQCMIAKVTSDIQKGNVGRNNELIDWLKSLKERVQPKPKEWSEKDEEMAEDLIKGCVSAEKAHHFVHTSKEIADWLKSLKDRIGG